MKEFKITERLTIRTSSLDIYLNEISKIPMLSNEDEIEVSIKASEGDSDAKHLLVKSNLRFIISVAKMYYNTNEPASKFEDLINEGNLGLIEAADSYDPNRGAKFISHAIWAIRKYMLLYLNNKYRTIRIPTNVNSSILNMNKLEGELASILNREPTRDELIDLYLEKYSDVEGKASKMTMNVGLNHGLSPASLDSPLKSDSEVRLIDTIDSNPDGLDHDINEQSNLEYLLYYINKLRFEIDKDIIISKLGLDGSEPQTNWQIARRYDMTPENIIIRFNRAILQLRSRLMRDNVTLDYFLN